MSDYAELLNRASGRLSIDHLHNAKPTPPPPVEASVPSATALDSERATPSVIHKRLLRGSVVAVIVVLVSVLLIGGVLWTKNRGKLLPFGTPRQVRGRPGVGVDVDILEPVDCVGPIVEDEGAPRLPRPDDHRVSSPGVAPIGDCLFTPL